MLNYAKLCQISVSRDTLVEAFPLYMRTMPEVKAWCNEQFEALSDHAIEYHKEYEGIWELAPSIYNKGPTKKEVRNLLVKMLWAYIHGDDTNEWPPHVHHYYPELLGPDFMKAFYAWVDSDESWNVPINPESARFRIMAVQGMQMCEGKSDRKLLALRNKVIEREAMLCESEGVPYIAQYAYALADHTHPSPDTAPPMPDYTEYERKYFAGEPLPWPRWAPKHVTDPRGEEKAKEILGKFALGTL